MPPKSPLPHPKLSSSTVERVLNDKELAELLDEMVKDAGVHTSIGYSAVLRQFLASDDVMLKVKNWEDEESKDDEKNKDDKTVSTAATSWIGGLTSSFTTKLAFDEETLDSHAISPLTEKGIFASPISTRGAMSDYGPTRTPKPTASTIVSPSRTFPSLPFTSHNDGFNNSPTFGKQLVEFMAPRNPFNLNLKDEAVLPKKKVKSHEKNLQSRRRTSTKQAAVADRLQKLQDDLSIDGDWDSNHSRHDSELDEEYSTP